MPHRGHHASHKGTQAVTKISHLAKKIRKEHPGMSGLVRSSTKDFSKKIDMMIYMNFSWRKFI